jgi:hypothetical protein
MVVLFLASASQGVYGAQRVFGDLPPPGGLPETDDGA